MAKKDEEEKKSRNFSTAAVTAMMDKSLTGLDWRVYLWVSLHDGRSLVRGAGMGCIASNKTLFAEVGCDYTAGCRTLSNLVDRGHLIREKTGRMTRYRVPFPDLDDLPDDNVSTGSAPAPEEQSARVNGCEPASENPGIGCRDFSGARTNQPKTDEHYILPSSKIDPSEEGIGDSAEAAHFADGEMRVEDFSDQISEIFGLRKDGAEAPAIQWSIDANLGEGRRAFGCKSPDAQMSMFERAFDAIGRDASRLDHAEGLRWGNWLLEMYGAHPGEPVGYRADRILEEWEASPPEVSIDQLRRWTREIILTNRCNTQGELADAAGMPAPVLSNFKNGKNLPDKYRLGLQAACDRFLPLHQWEAAA